ncbi:MAG: hypothetical protein RR410_04740, partial [Alistipes sp.]
MKKQNNNYARFYALLARMSGDREQIKETLIERFTHGRSTSLREMSTTEYEMMCATLDGELNHPGMSDLEFRVKIKLLRSTVLHRMQQLGIDTADWTVVDAFCLSPRIAGKKFAHLSVAELELMIPKLIAIAHNGLSTKPKP